MTPIIYLKGDATLPATRFDREVKIIAHICNDIGKWGRGFVVPLEKNHPGVRQAYLHYIGTFCAYPMLGHVLFYRSSSMPYTVIANMIAQSGIRSSENPTPIKYDALELALSKVTTYAKNLEAVNRRVITVHMPRIGCGLAGGKWERVEPIVTKVLSNKSVPITVYDLGGRNG